MKFSKTFNKDRKSVCSILWDEEDGVYYFSNRGKIFGHLYDMTADEAMHLEFVTQDDVKEKFDLKDLTIAGLHTNTFNPHIKWGTGVFLDEDENQLPYGVFRLRYHNSLGLVCEPFVSTINSGTLIKNRELKDDVIEFYNNPVIDRKNKKAFLLYGPPGNGKTTDIMSLFPLAEKMKWRILVINSKVDLEALVGMKRLLEKDKTIFIIEEITERIRGEIEDILTFLDGEHSWNNSVTIATTNYPEDMPMNLVDRPGRFETFIEYANPSKEDIGKLGEAFGFSVEQVSSLCGEKLSFDYVSFILSKAKSKGITPSESLKFERDRRKFLSNTFKGKLGLGD